MRVSKEIAGSHWESAVVEQTATDLQANGYVVSREEQIGKFRADLVARKGDETIVYEFKRNAWPKEKARQVAALRNYVVHDLGAKFRFVLVTPPQERVIDIPDIDKRLAEFLTNHVPNDLNKLSKRTKIEGVSDVNVTGIAFRPEGFLVSGNGVVHVNLDEGHEEGLSSLKESFPFTFEAVMNDFNRPVIMQFFDVNIETWYGDDDEAEDKPPRADEHDKNSTSGF